MKLIRHKIESKFNEAGSWSFGNDFVGNVVIFGPENSSSYTCNWKNNFFSITWMTTGAAEKIFNINFSKPKIKFCLSLHYNGDESYLHVNKTEICKFKANDNTSWYNFCLGSISKNICKRWADWNFFKWYCIWFFSYTIVQLKKKTYLILINI